MLAIVLLLASEPPPPSLPPPWRLIDRRGLHLGLRPAIFVTNDGPELAAGMTLQATAFVL